MRKSQARLDRRVLAVGAATVVGAAVALSGAVTPALAATYSVSTTQVAVAGGSFLYLTSGSAFTNSLGIRFALQANSCPTNYNTAQDGAVNGGAITALSTSVALIKTPALPAGTYKPCLYADASTGAAYSTDTTTDTVVAVNMGVESSTTGKATDKITLTAASAVLTGSTYATEFISGVSVCPTTYQTASGTVIVGATTKTSTTVLTVTVPTLTTGTSYLVCSYAGTTVGTSALAIRGKRTFTAYDATLPATTLNPTGGSSATASTITVSTQTSPFTGASPAALIAYNTCPSTYAAGATSLPPYAGTTTKISNSKVAVTVPSTVVVSNMDVTTPWHVCVYASSSSGALVAAPGLFSVAAGLSVSGAQFAVGSGAAASTGSGPAQGGSTITISGLTGVPTAAGALLSASLGGSPINNITAIDATSFSGTTTAHAAGPVNLTVTTAAGTKSTSNTPYTYTYGITVAPNTATSGSTPILDITGAGFGTLTFDTAADGVALDANKAYIMLTDNTWNAQDFSSNVDAQAVKAISFCDTPLVISDAEVICTLDLATKVASVATNAPTFTTAGDATDDVPAGTYTVTVANFGEDLKATDYDYSIVSSGSTFTVSPY